MFSRPSLCLSHRTTAVAPVGGIDAEVVCRSKCRQILIAAAAARHAGRVNVGPTERKSNRLVKTEKERTLRMPDVVTIGRTTARLLDRLFELRFHVPLITKYVRSTCISETFLQPNSWPGTEESKSDTYRIVLSSYRIKCECRMRGESCRYIDLGTRTGSG